MYIPTFNAKISQKFQSRIRIRKDPRAGSGSDMTLQVGSGSEIIFLDPQHWTVLQFNDKHLLKNLEFIVPIMNTEGATRLRIGATWLS